MNGKIIPDSLTYIFYKSTMKKYYIISFLTYDSNWDFYLIFTVYFFIEFSLIELVLLWTVNRAIRTLSFFDEFCLS